MSGAQYAMNALPRWSAPILAWSASQPDSCPSKGPSGTIGKVISPFPTFPAIRCIAGCRLEASHLSAAQQQSERKHYDRQSRILTCEHATSRVIRTGGDGEIKILASHYESMELDSPNDIIVRSDGSIFFTDPTYGRMDFVGLARDVELDFRGIFMVGPDAHSPILLASDFEQPNGLCLSPDERTLYVDDTVHGHIRSFEIALDGTISGGSVWAELMPRIRSVTNR